MSLPPPPPGLDIAQSNVPKIIGVVVSVRSISYVAIILRLTARRVARTKLWWDDWLIIAAGLLGIPSLVAEALIIKYGIGRHIWWVLETDPTMFYDFLRFTYADLLVYAPFIGAVKLSILCLYLRLFGINATFRQACYVQIGGVVIWVIITECIFAFQCNPIWLAWNPQLAAPGQCFAFAKIFLGTNTVNVIVDFAILCTPLVPIWRLQLPLKRKLAVTGVLLLGGCATVFSMTRLIFLTRMNYIDITWDDGIAYIWSLVEGHMGVFCACIPCFGPLLPKSWHGSSTEYGSRSSAKVTSNLRSNVLKSHDDRTDCTRIWTSPSSTNDSGSKVGRGEGKWIELERNAEHIHRKTEFTLQEQTR